MVSAGDVLQIYIFRSGEFLGTDVFAEKQIVIGRDKRTADLWLDSGQVSRRHAIIRITNNAITIEDLGSTNGVLLNDKPVQQAKIGRLDEIEIGDFVLKLKFKRKDKIEEYAGDPTAIEPVVPKNVAPEKNNKEGLKERERNKTDNLLGVQVRPETEKPVSKKPVSKKPVIQKPVADTSSIAHEKPRPISQRTNSESPTPPSEFAAVGDIDDDEDEDEDEKTYVPSYSLVSTLLIEDEKLRVAQTTPTNTVEVVAYSGETVIDVKLLHRGQSYWVGAKRGRRHGLSPRVRLLHVRRDGRCNVRFNARSEATRRKGNRDVSLKEGATANRHGVFATTMARGDILDIHEGAITYHVRYVVPPDGIHHNTGGYERWPAPLRPLMRIASVAKPSPLGARVLISSTGTHLIAFIVMEILATLTPHKAIADQTEFVEVVLDTELALEEPEPEPVKEPPPPEQPTARKPKKIPRRMQAAPSKKRAKAGGTSKAAAGVLGLLKRRGSSAAPGPAAATAAASNLSAVKAPGGSGGYRVSGLLQKLPTSKLSVGGGGGGPMTKGGTAIFRGGGGGAGRLAGGRGSRTVGGIVQKVPRQMRHKGQGSLDRDEIQRVINAGISSIQRCYERELTKTPGLKGKVQIEWTVAASGSVRLVRQIFSSLPSRSAVGCIMGSIKTWRFPRPRGGEVVVTYPFIFKSVGF